MEVVDIIKLPNCRWGGRKKKNENEEKKDVRDLISCRWGIGKRKKRGK